MTKDRKKAIIRELLARVEMLSFDAIEFDFDENSPILQIRSALDFIEKEFENYLERTA